MALGALNRYSHHSPKMNWFEQFFQYKDEFDDNHSLGSKMHQYFKIFLKDAYLLEEGKFSTFASLIERIGLQKEESWALILTNLSYTAQINWYVKLVNFNVPTNRSYIVQSAVDAGSKEAPAKDVWASLSRFADLPFNTVGLGMVDADNKKDPCIIRIAWENPDSRVILYSLYKFAEACGDYYQFSLKTLMDDTIERDGVSPTRIFGLDRATMVRILNGLSVSYPDFISASFTLDLDTITLNGEKSAADVLQLF